MVAARLKALPPWALDAAALGLVTLLLAPILRLPFFGDDVTVAEVDGYNRLQGWSFVELFATQWQGFVIDAGRPSLFAGLPGLPLMAVLGNNSVLYHAYLLAMTVVDGALLLVLLRRLGAPRSAAAVAVVLGIAWMQLRIYHDSLIAYGALVQWVLALVLGSLLLFDRWLTAGGRRPIVGAVLLFAAACALYEVAYTLCLPHLALALARRRGRQALLAAAPVLATGAAFMALSYVMRKLAATPFDNYTAGGGPWTIVRTYVVQLTSPLPVSSLLDDPFIAGSPTPAEWLAALWRGLVVGAVAAAGVVALARAPRVRWGPVVAVGIGLYLAPPALLALAPKYQAELTPSRGYLPILIQVFALAVLATAGLSVLARLAAARSRPALLATAAAAALLGGLAAGATAFNNVRIVAMLQPERLSRELVEAAAERGAFAAVPEGASILFTARDTGWTEPVPFRETPYAAMMLADRTGRTYDARTLPDPPPEPGGCERNPGVVQNTACAPPAEQAAWARVRLRRDGGTVIVAPLDRPTPTGYPQALTAPQLTVYREHDGDDPQPPRLIGKRPGGRGWSSDTARWTRLEGGDDWALYRLDVIGPRPIASSLDDDQGLVDFAAMPAPAERVRLYGTKQLLP